MLAIFFKAFSSHSVLSYLTLNVVNSYMNNRYLECSWVVGASGAEGKRRGRGAFFLLLQDFGVEGREVSATAGPPGCL